MRFGFAAYGEETGIASLLKRKIACRCTHEADQSYHQMRRSYRIMAVWNRWSPQADQVNKSAGR